MSEDTARALGASGSKSITIAGKECVARPLKAKELAEVQRDGVRRFKDIYLEDFVRNLKHYPPEMQEEKLDVEIKKVSAWDVTDLPARIAYDPAEIKVTIKLKGWLEEQYGESGRFEFDEPAKLATVYALDSGALSPIEYKALTQTEVKKHKISYIQWWVTGSIDGMVTMAWVCFKHNNVTRDQVAEAMGKDELEAGDVAKEIAQLSAPALGN